MTTPFDVFKVNEKVHVLCPVTKIWEESQITSFESSWKVKIDFLNWRGKYKNQTLEVPSNQLPEQWEIRKPIQTGSI